MKKSNLNRAGRLLMITLALPLALIILGFLSRSTGAADAALTLFLLGTFCVYVSFAAGLLVPVWIALVWLFGGSVERKRIVTLLWLSGLNIAVTIIWFFVFVRQFRIRW